MSAVPRYPTSCIHYAGGSDVGRVRPENQDRWIADPDRGLFLIADGMGGVAAGKLGADIVAEVLPSLLRQRLDPTRLDETAATLVRESLIELSDEIHETAKSRFGTNGVGATVVLAVIRGHEALIAHLGDSRAYLFRNELQSLTRDHSLLQVMLDEGLVSPCDVAACSRAQLTQFIGMQDAPAPAVRRLTLRPGDRLLLCTDGVWGSLSHERMEAIVAEKLPPAAICRKLIAAANAAGGTDNSTALVIDLAGK